MRTTSSSPAAPAALLENEVRPLVEAFLNERGLRLSPEKTKITHIAQGFDFLGQNIRRYNGLVLVKPSKKNTLAFLAKIRERIRDLQGAPQEAVIRTLNPLIRGWANYHCRICAKRTYKHVDSVLWQALWKWARRRHNNKPARWVAEKYWHPDEGHGWIFAADTGERTARGKPIRLRLLKTAQTPIRRHVKIRSEANPFDPAWRDYFEQRVLLKRIGPGWVDSHDFLPGSIAENHEQKPAVKTGSATAEF